MKTSAFIVAMSALLALSACANPIVAEPLAPADSNKNCAAIEEDISKTAALKREAREHDRFEWRYVFMVNAGVSWYRMNKAEQAAEQRLQELNQLAKSKGCL